MKLSLKVVPKSSRNTVVGWTGHLLKVCVTAPPEDGEANVAVIDVLAQTLGVPRAAVRIVSGAASRRKVVDIDGVEERDIQRRLASKSQKGER